MDDDFFTNTLRAVQYALYKILDAVDSKNLEAIRTIAKQEFKAINDDIDTLKKGEKN